MQPIIAKLIVATAQYDAGDPKRIQHLIKVHDLAATIGTLEGMSPAELLTLEAAAVVHDIGIHEAERKHHSSSGKWQEQEGPTLARQVLIQVGGFSPEQVERVCFLVGHHHTYANMQGLDYQALVEADFLVNLYEDQVPLETVPQVEQRIFRTATGIRLLHAMFATRYVAP